MLNSIKGRILLIFATVTLLFAFVVVFVFVRNENTADSIKSQVVSLRFPLASHSASILVGINRVASMQRMYLLTLDKTRIHERAKIWRTEIYPALDSLKKLQPFMQIEENVKRIDTLYSMLPMFEDSQKEMTVIIDANIENDILTTKGTKGAYEILQGDALYQYTTLSRVAKQLNTTQTERVGENVAIMISRISNTNSTILSIFGVVILIFVVMGYILIHNLSVSVQSVVELVMEVGQGKLVTKRKPPKNELGEIVVAVNNLVDKFERESEYAIEIGQGNFTVKLDTNPENVMGMALTKARNSLVKLTKENQKALQEAQAQEEELKQHNEEMQTIQDDLERKSADFEILNKELGRRINARTADLQTSLEVAEKQKQELQIIQETLKAKQAEMENAQIIEGYLSKLDDLMRLNYDKSIQEFTDIILHNICKVTHSMRGVMFILQDSTLKAVGGYACTPETLGKRDFQLGENLLGQAAKTKEFIVLDDLPASSARVASALSQVENGNIMIIPLVYNEDVQGVIELTSLKPYETEQIEFGKRACKNVAAMLQNIFSNMKTQLLLAESQEISSRLQAQEEEARQTVEELRATQEKSKKEQAYQKALWAAVHSSNFYLEMDKSGVILTANALLLHHLGYEVEEVIGKQYNIFVETDFAKTQQYENFWAELRQGKPQGGHFKFLGKNRKEFWFSVSLTPVIREEDGQIIKIMMLASDITDLKKV